MWDKIFQKIVMILYVCVIAVGCTASSITADTHPFMQTTTPAERLDYYSFHPPFPELATRDFLDASILSDPGNGPPWIASCLGDSVTNGYPYAGTGNTYPAQLLTMLEAAYGSGNFGMINHGVNGYRADQVLADLQNLNWLEEDDPDIVLLMVGGNDLLQEVEPDGSNLFAVIDQTVTEVQAIVDAVTAHTNTDGSHPRIIVSAFIPNHISGSLGSLAVSLYNDQLENDLTGIDLWITDNWDDFYDPATAQAKASLMYDTVHPNAEGYAVMAENWFGAISEDLSAGVYYVSQTGNDSNPGTLDQPWRTIQHAVETVGAGDTIFVRGGTYNEWISISNSGLPGQPSTATWVSQ